MREKIAWIPQNYNKWLNKIHKKIWVSEVKTILLAIIINWHYKRKIVISNIINHQSIKDLVITMCIICKRWNQIQILLKEKINFNKIKYIIHQINKHWMQQI